ncbi:MAG: protein kinase [Acidimicrobiales bacterium]|nr:protein kinase [Acidimicrobiales bacterium]
MLTQEAAAGRVVLEAPIARGTLGTLWRARDALGRPVAAKRIPVCGDAELIGLLDSDGARLAALDRSGSDPAAILAWSVEIDGPCVVLVMDLVAGGSWADRLPGGIGRDADEVRAVGASVATCLARLHSEGLVHGDLKPSAVLFDGPPEAGARVRLGDAGLAIRFAATDRFGPRAQATAGRLDPAVAAGHPFGPPSDVYVLGVLCAEMLLGGLPTSRSGATRTPGQEARSLAGGLARLRHAAPSGLVAAIHEALAPSPASRPTAAELAATLVETSARPLRHASLPSAGRTPTGDPPRPRPLRPTRTPRRSEGPGPRNPWPGNPWPRNPWPRNPWHGRRTRGRRRIAAWCAVATVAILLVGGLWRAAAGPDGTVRRAGSSAAPCPGSGNAAREGGRLLGEADVTGRGCVSPVVQVGQELEVGSAGGEPAQVVRFRPAVPGGQVVLGDFGCGRRETPALYDPRTGEVFVYLRWPRPGRKVGASRVLRTGVTGGRLVVRRSDGTPCSSVQVLSPPAAAQRPLGGNGPGTAGG